MVRLVPLANAVIPKVQLVNMHLIKDSWKTSIILSCRVVGYIGTNGTFGTTRKCHSNGSAGEYSFKLLSFSKVPGILPVHHYFIEISHKFTWTWKINYIIIIMSSQFFPKKLQSWKLASCMQILSTKYIKNGLQSWVWKNVRGGNVPTPFGMKFSKSGGNKTNTK